MKQKLLLLLSLTVTALLLTGCIYETSVPVISKGERVKIEGDYKITASTLAIVKDMKITERKHGFWPLAHYSYDLSFTTALNANETSVQLFKKLSSDLDLMQVGKKNSFGFVFLKIIDKNTISLLGPDLAINPRAIKDLIATYSIVFKDATSKDGVPGLHLSASKKKLLNFFASHENSHLVEILRAAKSN